ncbi:MAG: FAD-dependent oxidoreductase [Pirellulaceae bacterium]
MRIAIVGSGISGMTAAYYLGPRHQVSVFEAGNYIGGHTNTIEFTLDDRNYAVDTGFIVFNDRTYPNFIKLLQQIGAKSKPTAMTFSVRCDKSGLEYRGADLNGFFAQRINVLNPFFYHLLYEMLRFNRNAERAIDESENPDITVGEFFAKFPYSKRFREQFFLPMASAIWSCPGSTIEQFPMRFIVEFYRNHGLLSVNDRPQWRVIDGGSQQYMRRLVSQTHATLHTNSPVRRMERQDSGVTVYGSEGILGDFDHVIFACHSDQALRILGEQASSIEREILTAFPYESNTAVLHTDTSVLPDQKRAWACWNYHIPACCSDKATVTYNMNILQGIESKHTFCVSLNSAAPIKPAKVIRTIEYHHPIFTPQRRSMQQRHNELIDHHHTSFCGAYWGNGFHEDGVVSALNVCRKLDKDSCTVLSTRDGFDTGDSRRENTTFELQSV